MISSTAASRRSRECASVLILAGLLLAMGLPLRATAATPASSDDLPTSVIPPRRPTEVAIAAYLIGLSRVSEPSEAFPTYEVEMFVDVSWKDPRLAFASDAVDARVFQEEEAEEKLSEIWSPDLEIQNEVEQRESESIQLTISRDGAVKYEERFGATLNADMDLRRFPFDTQIFDIELQSFVWNEGDCSLIADNDPSGFDPDFETPEWSVTATTAQVSARSEIRDDRAFSTYTFRIHAERRAGHYVFRVMLPLAFVMSLTWCAFWMPVEQRIRVGFIALLTVVASHTVIARDLPRLHYPTFADVLLIVCYLFATVLILVGIWVQRLEEGGSLQRASAIDVRARWALPVIAAVSLCCSVLLLWS